MPLFWWCSPRQLNQMPFGIRQPYEEVDYVAVPEGSPPSGAKEDHNAEKENAAEEEVLYMETFV